MKPISTLLQLTVVLLGLVSCQHTTVECNDCEHFRCLVDGRQFLPGGPWKSTTLASYTYDSSKTFSVYANSESEYVSIYFKLNDVIKPGVYELADSTISRGTYLNKTTNKIYRTTASVKGVLNLTRMDYGNRPLAEGTFSFRAVDNATKEIVTLTEGSFRVYFANY